MRTERKRSFVLIVESDRIVAATLAGVLQAGGYMAASTRCSDATLRIASRVVIDAAIIDADASDRNHLKTAVALQERYPQCRILLLSGQSHAEDVSLFAEETGLDCEILVRPLSRAELLAKLAETDLQRSEHNVSRRQLQAA
jgi:DNA-binding response OmpR family regulator